MENICVCKSPAPIEQKDNEKIISAAGNRSRGLRLQQAARSETVCPQKLTNNSAVRTEHEAVSLQGRGSSVSGCATFAPWPCVGFSCSAQLETNQIKDRRKDLLILLHLL